MWHGIIVNKSLVNDILPPNYKIFNEKIIGTWTIYGIEVKDAQIDSAVQELQNLMIKGKPFYNYFYDNKEVMVIFKDKMYKFLVGQKFPEELLEYGKQLNIPPEQLDFYPNKFSQEEKYFLGELSI